MFHMSKNFAIAILLMAIAIQCQSDPSMASSSADAVVILSVSTQLGVANSNPFGSLAGGTRIYMKVTGLDQTASNNQVTVGQYPCLVDDKGVNGLFINCVTSAPSPTDTNLSKLPITVQVVNKAASTCTFNSYYCTFTYTINYTPILTDVAPRSVFPRALSNWRAKWTISNNDVPYLEGQFFGTNRCDRFSIKDQVVDQINSWDDIVSCQVSGSIEAGYYPLQIKSYSGYQFNDFAINQKFIKNDNSYQSKIVPLITSISSNYVSSKGQILLINGYGFSGTASNIQVTVPGSTNTPTVLSSTVNQIQVLIPPLSQPTDTKFYASTGLRYTRYNLAGTGLDGSCGSFRTQITTNPAQIASLIVEDDIIPEPETLNTFGTDYAQYIRGFIKAPFTGNYKFYLASDDCASVYIQTTAGDTTQSTMTQVSYNDWSPSRNYWYNVIGNPTRAVNQISKSFPLTADNYYYIEIYHCNGGSVGHLAVSLEIESTAPAKFNQVYDLWQFSTSYAAQFETIQYTLYNSAANVVLAGAYQLNFQYSDGQPKGVNFNYTTANLTLTSTVAQIASAINSATGYTTSVVATKVDSTGTALPANSAANTPYAGYQYVITFNRYRAVAVQRVLPTIKTYFTVGTPVTNVVRTQDAGNPISGTFRLSVDDANGNNVVFSTGSPAVLDLPYNVDPAVIAQNFYNIFGISPIVWSTGTGNDGYNIYIYTRGIASVANFQVSLNQLVSGGGSGAVTATITKSIPQTTNMLFEPIPNELLYIQSTTPQVQLTVNGIQAGCPVGVCDFTLADSRTPTLESFSVSGAVLTVTLTAGTALPTLQTSLLSIKFAGAECTGIQSVAGQTPPSYQFNCNLEQQNGATVVEAGVNIPSIHYQGIGFALYSTAASAAAITTNIVVTSVTPASGTPDGGTLITIVGSGFAKNAQEGLTITVGTTSVTPISISNKQITLITPAGTDGAIKITYGQSTLTSNAFTYDVSLRIAITSLSFTNQSPVYRGSITITGNNFGSSISDLTVILSNAQKTYPCVVQSVSADGTTIQAYLRGGLPGTYTFTVNRINFGNSQATGTNAQFQYATIITGISPNEGSQAGGTTITITGQNFYPSATTVFIGNAVNWMCKVKSVTATQIVCITPPQNSLASYSSPVDVAVLTNSYLESVCASGSNCQFTYKASLTPTLNALPTGASSLSGARLLEEIEPNFNNFVKVPRILSTHERHEMGHDQLLNVLKSTRRNLLTADDLVITVQKTYLAGATETLTGTGFDSPVVVTFVQGTLNFTASATLSADKATITYTIPDMPAGDYATYVNAPTGNANLIWNTRIQLTLASITPTSVVVGGQVITISGGGFNAATVLIGPNPCQQVTQLPKTQYSSLTCRIPQLGAQVYQVSVTQLNSAGVTITSTTQVSLTVASANSPVITAVTSATNLAYSTAQSATVYTGSPSTLAITLTGSTLSGTSAVATLETSTGTTYTGSATVNSVTSITFSFTNIPIGQYSIFYTIDGKIAAWSNKNQQKLIVTGQAPTSNNPTTSIAGGATITFTGSGFDTNIANNAVEVCGFPCSVTSATFNSLSCSAPLLPTQSVVTTYPSLQGTARYISASDVTITSDSNPTQAQNIFDGFQSTYYKSASTTGCWVLLDFGITQFTLTQFMYQPRVDQLAQNVQGSAFFYTTDGTTWQNLVTIGQNVHTDWNIYVPNSPIQGILKIKYQDTVGKTQCQMADLKLKGFLQYSTTNSVSTPTPCSAQITVNGQNIQVNSAVTYSQSVTPIVTSVSPLYGSKAGGTTITITGTGFTANQSSVSIDGVPCTVTSSSTTQIVCTTGVKNTATNLLRGVFVVSSNGNNAVNQQIFTYANRWSDISTWGGVVAPGDGDSVIINSGETLLVDMLTPKLVQILCQGAIIFDDAQPTSLNAEYIVIVGGAFTIGTEQQPHTNKVTITLYGNQLDTQMPDLGNKVLGCHQCTLDIHGVVRTPTWTLLSSTANIGDTTITVDDAVDWQVGEQIVITSSDFEHAQAETKYITAVSADKKTLTLDTPFVNQHYSAVETYGIQKFPMKVEVGLLSRNIVIQGSPDDATTLYGYHLMVHGQATQGAIGRISYAEFRYGGQPMIKGRYPIHFHLNGDVADSYVRGNSIHNNFARCVTIHGVHYLTVEKNVCYNTFGHAIFLEDGIETDNIIQDNLVVSIKQSWIMLQTDITCATYWITNPQNILRRNRSGGSEWYGFWYEVKDNPDGPSATSDICPPGLNIIEFADNVGHSNGHYGLRIFKLQPRQFPCQPARNDSAVNPFSDNPSIQGQFTNFTTWKNGFAGILAEEMGNVLFDQIMIAESGVAGYQGHKTNMSAEGVVLQNALIVGQSRGNPSKNSTFYVGSTALIVPRTNGFLAQNIIAYRFLDNMIIIQSCSFCQYMKLWVTGGKNTQFKNITVFESPTAQMIFWMQWRREIFWDLDGSIVASLNLNYPNGAFLTASKPHLQNIAGCTTVPSAVWNNSVICDMSKVQIRDVLVNQPVPDQDFRGTTMNIYRLDPAKVNDKIDSTIQSSAYTGELMQIIKPRSNDIPFSMASDFVTGYTYNIHFGFGAADFDSVGIFPSPYFAPTDLGIVFRFNYSSYRQYFDTLRNIGGLLTLNYSQVAAIPDPVTCSNGDWFLNTTSQNYFLCMSGKNKTVDEFIQINPIVCRVNCSSIGNVPLETGTRKWSDPTTWESGAVPKAGENATIQASYKVVMDVDPPELYFLSVLGQLIFDVTRPSSTLKAHYIWARSGTILAGSATTPFPGKISINILGEFGDTAMLIADGVDTSNKLFVITNGIELYGITPQTVWTRLTAEAHAGDTTITVAGTITDWKAGDQLVIGPSGSDPEQQEKVTIVSVSGQVVTLASPIKYYHYGDPSVTIVKPGIGQLDMRAGVGHLTRNIQIIGGPSINGWGGRLLIYQFTEPGSTTGIPRRGYGIFQGVEFNNMGQYGSQSAGLDLRNLNSPLVQTPSSISGCSFHDSTGMLLSIQQSQFITVTNNVFYNGQKALVQAIDATPFVFKNNLLVYVQLRQEDPESHLANWAVFGNFIYSDTDTTLTTTDFLEVAFNTGQGSQDTGFFFMATPCANSDKASFHDNECSASVLACYGVHERDTSASDCNYISGTHAFASQHGIQAVMLTQQIKTDKMILVENGINFILKSGTHQILDCTFTVSNSYMSPLARPICTNCYADQLAPYCKNTFSFQLGTTTTSAFPPISKKPSTAYDTICTIQGIDHRVYVNNVQFENVRLNYTGLPQCGNNAVFRQHHNAVDMSAQHYLTQTTCTNCHFDALLFNLRDPDPELASWFGGCGSFVCTGMLNVLIEDQDGSFFGEIGQGISNNSYYGPNVTHCARQKSWNGYWCPGTHATVLNFMSTAPDYNLRLYSPIHLTDGLFWNELNSYKEWEWNGPEPLNLRESRFVGIVTKNTVINMTNAGMNPSSSLYWLSRKYAAGSPKDWVILKYQFSSPQVLQVSVNGQVILPGITQNNAHWNLLSMTDQCGANNYFYKNYTVHIVVTGAQNCKVAIKQLNTMQISTRIQVTNSQFFGNDFLKYAQAQLGGDPYNYFILGTSGSRRLLQGGTTTQTITWAITDSGLPGTDAAKNSNANLQATAAKLTTLSPSNQGFTISSSTVDQISVTTTLNAPSTEPTSAVVLTPGGSTTPTTGSSGSSGSTGSSGSSGSTGSTNTPSTNTTTNPPLTQGNSTINPNATLNSTNTKQNDTQFTIQKTPKSGNDDTTVTIVVSVVVSVIGLSLIIAGLLWYKKTKLARIAAMQAQRVDNEFNKANHTEDNILRVPE